MFVGIGMGLVGGGAQTSIQSLLFGQSEPGFMFTPQDITTLYQDRVWATPVTAAGQSVGLRLDKSKGLALGPELVTNGDGSSASAWNSLDGGSASSNGSVLTVTASGAYSGVSQPIAIVAGKTYQLTAVVRSVSGSGVDIRFDFHGVVYSPTSPTFVTLRQVFTASSTQAIKISSTSAGGVVEVDNISVREIAGNHQVAINDAKRGVYGWMPKTGRRNRLLYTSQFDNAAWGKFGPSVTPNTALAPDGSMTADTLTMTGANDYLLQTTSVTLGEITTFSTWIRTVSGSAAIRILIDSGTPGNVSPDIPVTTEWQRISFTGTITGTGSRNVGFQGQSAGGTVQYYIWNGQFETGGAATADQIVNSQYDVTEAGVPTCYYVQADGVDDAYVTPTITPGTDKVQVFAGVRKLSDAAAAIVAEMGTTGTQNGVFTLTAPLSGANYYFNSRGTGDGQAISATSFAAPITNVLTGLGDISGDTATLRVNGTQVAQSTADQGTGNYLAYPAYIYGRGGTSLPFNGLDFGHVVRFGPNLDAATIARVESLIARNTPEVDFMFGGVWTDQYNWDDETNWNDGA